MTSVSGRRVSDPGSEGPQAGAGEFKLKWSPPPADVFTGHPGYFWVVSSSFPTPSDKQGNSPIKGVAKPRRPAGGRQGWGTVSTPRCLILPHGYQASIWDPSSELGVAGNDQEARKGVQDTTGGRPSRAGPTVRAPVPFCLESGIRMESCGLSWQEGRGVGLGEGPGHSPGVSPASAWLFSTLGILQLQGLIQLSEHLEAFTPTDLRQGRRGIKKY